MEMSLSLKDYQVLLKYRYEQNNKLYGHTINQIAYTVAVSASTVKYSTVHSTRNKQMMTMQKSLANS